MAPLIKESLELSTSIAEPAVSAVVTSPKQASGQMRADAVSIEIPVKVHGSRVTQVVREVTPHTEPFEEQTSTMIVFPHGAVLRMSTAVTVGQMLVVTNSKTRQDAICRVVKVRTFTNAQGYVEIEFSHPQAGYWGVSFSGDAPAAASKPASTPPPTIPREEPKKDQASDISWAPARVASPPISKPTGTSISLKHDPEPVAPPSAPVSRPSMPTSSFILIGSQEDTQPSASSSTYRANPIPATPPRIEPEREMRAPEPPKRTVANDFPAAPPVTPVPSLSMAELLGDELAVPVQPDPDSIPRESSAAEESLSAAADAAIRSSQSSFGSLSGGSTLELGPSRRGEVFGSLLDASVSELTGVEAAPRQSNGLLIAISIFVVFAAVIGGGFYFRHELGIQKPNQRAAAPLTTPASQIASNDSNGSSIAQPLATQGAQPASNPNSVVPTITIPSTTVTVSANPAPAGTRASTSSVVPSNAPAAAQPPKGPSVTSDMLASTLNAHPVSSSRGEAAQPSDAPTVDTSAADSSPDSSLPGLASSSNVASPPPPVVPEGPVTVGGEVKAPRLITLKQPNYPSVAKEAHIQGDVVISTQIDKVGNVVQMKIVSGPMMLRQPALDALKHWKYAPSTLNGQPVSVEMQVIIKFRM
jgi:TonB family protein